MMNDNLPGGGHAPGRGSWMGILALILSVAALGLSGTALYFALREEPLPPEPETFQYGGQTLVAVEGLARNPYDRESFYIDEKGRVAYEKDGLRAKTGVDVSTYQGEIDWQAVAADGIDFAIIRLGYRGYTEGGLMMDEGFERNIRGALDAGLEVGVYFFSQAVTPEEAQAEAAFVLNAIEPYQVTYPVAFDWEPITGVSSARTHGLDGGTLTRCAAAFCARVAQAGYEPAVYFNQNLGYFSYDLRQVDEYTLWLAEYDGKPDFFYHFDLWQYTHTGTVDGIEGDVDLDLDLRPFQPA